VTFDEWRELSEVKQDWAKFLVLERLAVAAERIADAGNASVVSTSTPFLWERVPCRCFLGVHRLVSEKWFQQRFGEREWPLTCEDLEEIGPDNVGACYGIGPVGVLSIGAQLRRQGFDKNEAWR